MEMASLSGSSGQIPQPFSLFNQMFVQRVLRRGIGDVCSGMKPSAPVRYVSNYMNTIVY